MDKKLTTGTSRTLVFLARIFFRLVLYASDCPRLWYSGGDRKVGHVVRRDTVVCTEVAEAIVVSGRRLWDSGDAGCPAVVRVTCAFEGMVSGHSGGATRADGQRAESTGVYSDRERVAVDSGAVVRTTAAPNTDSLEVHFKIEGERTIGRWIGGVGEIIKGLGVRGEGLVCTLGGDCDGGRGTTRWGIGSQKGVSVVGVNGEKLELNFVESREAGIQFELEEIGMRCEDVRWRVK